MIRDNQQQIVNQRQIIPRRTLGEINVILLGDRGYISWSLDKMAVFDREVTAVIEGLAGRPLVVLDYSTQTYISSTHMARLIRLQKAVRLRGGEIVLCRLSPEIVEVFEITKLTHIFRLFATCEEAIEALQAYEAT